MGRTVRTEEQEKGRGNHESFEVSEGGVRV